MKKHNAVEDLEKIMNYSKQHYKEINLYGCSIGVCGKLIRKC